MHPTEPFLFIDLFISFLVREAPIGARTVSFDLIFHLIFFLLFFFFATRNGTHRAGWIFYLIETGPGLWFSVETVAIRFVDVGHKTQHRRPSTRYGQVRRCCCCCCCGCCEFFYLVLPSFVSECENPFAVAAKTSFPFVSK